MLSVGVAAARVVAPPATAAIEDSRSAGGRTGAGGIGNVTALINESQAVVARCLYDPFGNIVASSGPLADANRYRFSSKEQPNGANYNLTDSPGERLIQQGETNLVTFGSYLSKRHG